MIAPSLLVGRRAIADLSAAGTPVADVALARRWTRQTWLASGCSTSAAIVRSYHPQSAAYFDACDAAPGGAPDLTIDRRIAWDSYIRRLESAGTRERLLYLYPWLGGTAASNRINAGSAGPAAGLGTFVGTVTHDANGVTSDGVSGYFNTGVAPANCMYVDDGCLFAYTLQAEAAGATRYRLGASGVPSAYNGLTSVHYGAAGTRRRGGVALLDVAQAMAVFAGPDMPGLLTVSYYGTRSGRLFDGTGLLGVADVPATGTLPDSTISVLALNAGGGSVFYATKTNALAGFGRGLTDAQVVAYDGYTEELMANLNRLKS